MTTLLDHLLHFGWQIVSDEATRWVLKKEGEPRPMILAKPKHEQRAVL